MMGSRWTRLVELLLITIFLISGSDSYGRKRLSPPRRRIRVATILVEPYMKMKQGSGLWVGNEKFEGYYADLIGAIANAAGFDYELRLVPDGKIGMNISNSWNGIIGEIVRGNADLALAPIMPTEERRQVVDMTAPVSQVYSTMVMRKSTTSISSLRDLSRSRSLVHGVIHNSETEYAMADSDNTVIQGLYQKINATRRRHTVRNVLDGIERVRRGNFVLLLDSERAKHVVRQDPCNLKMVGSFLVGRQHSFAVNKNSDILVSIDRAIKQLQRQRVEISRFKFKWWPNKCGYTILTNGSLVNSSLFHHAATTATTTAEVYRPRPLIVSSALLPPYLMRVGKRGRKKFVGFFNDVLQMIASEMGFSFEFRLLPQTGLSENSAKNQTVQEMLTRNADIALVPFNFDDISAIDGISFTRAIYRYKHTLLVRRSLGSDPLSDIILGNRTKIGVLRRGGLLDKLYHSGGQLYETMFQKVTQNKKRIYSSLVDALNRINRRNFGLVLEEPLAKYIQDKSPCSLRTVGSFLRSSGYKILLRSSLIEQRDNFNKAIKYLHKNGTIARLQNKWWGARKCTGHRMVPSNETRSHAGRRHRKPKPNTHQATEISTVTTAVPVSTQSSSAAPTSVRMLYTTPDHNALTVTLDTTTYKKTSTPRANEITTDDTEFRTFKSTYRSTNDDVSTKQSTTTELTTVTSSTPKSSPVTSSTSPTSTSSKSTPTTRRTTQLRTYPTTTTQRARTRSKPRRKNTRRKGKSRRPTSAVETTTEARYVMLYETITKSKELDNGHKSHRNSSMTISSDKKSKVSEHDNKENNKLREGVVSSLETSNAYSASYSVILTLCAMIYRQLYNSLIE